jgi:hypothetical protein
MGPKPSMRLLQAVVHLGDAETVSTAASMLGVLLAEQRDLSGAHAAYRQVIDSGHTEWAGLAGLRLGLLLREGAIFRVPRPSTGRSSTATTRDRQALRGSIWVSRLRSRGPPGSPSRLPAGHRQRPRRGIFTSGSHARQSMTATGRRLRRPVSVVSQGERRLRQLALPASRSELVP